MCQCGSRGTIPVPSFDIFILAGFIWMLPKCTCVSWMLALSPFPASYEILTRKCLTSALKKWGNVRVKLAFIMNCASIIMLCLH